MNTTVPPDSSWTFGTSKIGRLGYGIGVSIGILLLITTITLASYYCTRNHISASPTIAPTRRRRTNGTAPPGDDDGGAEPLEHFSVDVGLDEETIKSYPKLPYEEARVSYSQKRNSSTASCCSICLADYESRDMIRVLPDCDHLFHAKCVDPWLRLHPTCPVCRTSPLPTPVTTPLAEAAPFGGRLRG